MTEELLPHSPLGASGAERFMECPGSVLLAVGVRDDDEIDLDNEHSKLGTHAHHLGEACLREGLDAWETVGHVLGGGLVIREMADAVQIYLNAVRAKHPEFGNSFGIEHKFHCPSLHKYFYGTVDFWHLDRAKRRLDIWDYKHGVGVQVDVIENPQEMYYACGILEELDLWEDVDVVVLHIAQPRGFHHDGPIRQWSTLTIDLRNWLDYILLPAMDNALVSRETKSGEHCRFCPVRFRACPQLEKDVNELEALMADIDAKGGAPKATNAQIARLLDLGEVFKIALKAAKDTAFVRLQKGADLGEWALVQGKSNRQWREDAHAFLVKRYGQDAMTAPELKSPAQIENLPEGEKYAAEYAFKPPAGLVVAKGGSRPKVSRDTKSMFTDQTKRKGKAA